MLTAREVGNELLSPGRTAPAAFLFPAPPRSALRKRVPDGAFFAIGAGRSTADRVGGRRARRVAERSGSRQGGAAPGEAGRSGTEAGCAQGTTFCFNHQNGKTTILEVPAEARI